MKSISKSFMLVIICVLLIAISGSVTAAVTTKTLATNFTVANLSSSTATVNVAYYKADGSVWEADLANTTFTLPPDGGQKQIRQYFDTTMDDGTGSAVISSDQPVAALSLLLTRSGTPTSGGYSGIMNPNSVFYVPLVMKNLTTANGIANSQLVIQNTTAENIQVTIDLKPDPATSLSGTLKNVNLSANATLIYDLDTEAGLVNGWNGSAVITGVNSKNISVISNLFIGPDLLYTTSGFSSNQITDSWYVPYYASKFINGQNTSVTVQNLSGGTIAENDLVMICKKDENNPGVNEISFTNGIAVPNNGSFTFNAAALATSPVDWFGSCFVETSSGDKNLAVSVYVRHIGNPTNGGGSAFEGIPAPSLTNVELYKKITVPYIAKALGNGVASSLNIQNLSSSDANVTLKYTASAEYSGLPQSYTTSIITIPAGQSLLRNYRYATSSSTSEPSLPEGWFGSLVVESDQPVQVYSFITNRASAIGDTYFGFTGFLKP